MIAAILSIGDELTLGQNQDTNGPWLAERLAGRAIETVEHRTVSDDRQAIASAIGDLAGRVDLLLITGGLGPTPDDLTRFALGDVLTPGEALVSDPQAEAWLKKVFARVGRPMPESNLVQALRPATMRCLENRRGTACGLAGTRDRCRIYALPGPPHELEAMFLRRVLEDLPAPEAGQVLRGAAVHCFGLGESDAAERLGSLLDRTREPLVGITFADAVVTARVRSRGPEEVAAAALEETLDQIQQKWGPYCYGRDSQTLASSAGTLLREAGLTLATAESCTGGLLGAMIVEQPGASDFYLGGWVSYDDRMKVTALGVPVELIEQHGAVSESVARAMACGALQRSGAECALAITGVAGPGGGSAGREVGTVHIALGRTGPGEPRLTHRTFQFVGSRSAIRSRATKAALQMLRFCLLEIPDPPPLLWERAETDSAKALQP